MIDYKQQSERNLAVAERLAHAAARVVSSQAMDLSVQLLRLKDAIDIYESHVHQINREAWEAGRCESRSE